MVISSSEGTVGKQGWWGGSVGESFHSGGWVPVGKVRVKANEPDIRGGSVTDHPDRIKG